MVRAIESFQSAFYDHGTEWAVMEACLDLRKMMETVQRVQPVYLYEGLGERAHSRQLLDPCFS